MTRATFIARFPHASESTIRANVGPFVRVQPSSPAPAVSRPVSPKSTPKARRPSKLSTASQLFFGALTAAGLPLPVREHRFHAVRKWRFDYAWPDSLLALEVDGGIWIRGGHNRGAQMLKTWQKENEAVCAGWRILRCQPVDLAGAETLGVIRRALGVTRQVTCSRSG